jgi:hypothetical protein
MTSTILHERVRQARRTYEFSLFLTVACLFPGLISTFFVAVGQYPRDAMITALPIISCIQFLRDSRDHLDRLLAERQKDEYAQP